MQKTEEKENKMNPKQKLKLFWKITDLVNKKFCRNKLAIKKIHLFTNLNDKKEKKTIGLYDEKIKEIYVKNEFSDISQLLTFFHELTHAYEHQVLKRDYSGINRLRENTKRHSRLLHNKRFRKNYSKLLQEAVRNMNFEIKVK